MIETCWSLAAAAPGRSSARSSSTGRAKRAGQDTPDSEQHRAIGVAPSWHTLFRMRLSRLFLPTEREAPADAEAVSHKLMVRAGLVRQVGAGLYSWLPAGWRIHRKVEQIVREEIDAIGGQEMLMPVMHPAELWKRSGRYGFPEQFRLHDRKGAEHVLAMTHEEVVAFHVANAVRSYRQ